MLVREAEAVFGAFCLTRSCTSLGFQTYLWLMLYVNADKQVEQKTSFIGVQEMYGGGVCFFRWER